MDDIYLHKQENFWKDRDYSFKYWTWRTGELRSRWLADVLKEYDFNSIFEFGMNSGRNLKAIKNKFPNIIIGGMDISEKAIQFAKENIVDGCFESGSVYDYNNGAKYDIVLTMGFLIHIVPNKIEDIIKMCINKANKYIFHLEGFGGFVLEKGKPIYTGKNIINPLFPFNIHPKPKLTFKNNKKFFWQPNITKVYTSLGFDKTKITKTIPPNTLYHQKDANGLMIIKL